MLTSPTLSTSLDPRIEWCRYHWYPKFPQPVVYTWEMQGWIKVHSRAADFMIRFPELWTNDDADL